jgi:hypothetical protein
MNSRLPLHTSNIATTGSSRLRPPKAKFGQSLLSDLPCPACVRNKAIARTNDAIWATIPNIPSDRRSQRYGVSRMAGLKVLQIDERLFEEHKVVDNVP